MFRYNKVVGSARALDLVETEEEYFDNVKSDPLYNHAWVYGNIFINEVKSAMGFSIRMIHWGFDNSSAHARVGNLYFYNNTVINKGIDPTGAFWYTSIFQMGSSGYNADHPENYQINAWENVFVNEATSTGYGKVDFRLLWDLGKVNFYGTNFLTTNWKRPSGDGVLTENTSTVLEYGSSVIDVTTGLPLTNSSILNRGVTFVPNFSQYASITGFSAVNLSHASEFDFSNSVPKIKPKTLNGLRDLGAFERQ